MDVSIIVPVYNHEKYIQKALQSILNQVKNFSYEVLIGEDCSTDRSREILKSLEPNLPKEFKIFYRDHNLGIGNNGNAKDLYMRSNGRYAITLEADDYWTYDRKIQTQFDFLESHPDYIATAHNVTVVNEYGTVIDYSYPECKTEEYTIEDYKKGILPGQTASILFKNYYHSNILDYEVNVGNYLAGDRVKAFLLISYGKVFCFQEKWSAYRFVTSSGSSFSATHKPTSTEKLSLYLGIYNYARNHNIKTASTIAAEQLLFFYLVRCFIKRVGGITLTDLKQVYYDSVYKDKLILFVLHKLLVQPKDKFLYIKSRHRVKKCHEQ